MIPEDLVPAGCPWTIVLGFDPGTRVAGWGAVVVAPEGPRLVGCGVLRAPATAAVPERLARILEGLELLLDRLQPAVVALEGAFHAKNVRSAIRLGEARGLALAAAARRGAQVMEIPPATAKKAIVGHGAASKEQVAAMVAHRLGPEVLAAPADATDALALALACVQARERAARLGEALG